MASHPPKLGRGSSTGVLLFVLKETQPSLLSIAVLILRVLGVIYCSTSMRHTTVLCALPWQPVWCLTVAHNKTFKWSGYHMASMCTFVGCQSAVFNCRCVVFAEPLPRLSPIFPSLAIWFRKSSPISVLQVTKTWVGPGNKASLVLSES